MSASMNWIAWNSAIGLPNCWRSFAYAQRRVVRAARHPERQGRDRDAAAVEDLHRVHEPLAALADQLARRERSSPP